MFVMQNGGQASQTKASAAVIAPFRGTEGGLPILPEKHRQRKDPTDITDFGESLYSKARRARSRRSSFSIPPRDDGRRRTKTKKTLQDRLFRALVPTHESGKEFFPKKVLSAIVNRQCVYEELSKHLADSHSEEMINQYAKRICDKTEYIDDNGVRKTTRFLKIFVILVLIDKTPAITKFLEIGLSDKDLPLQYVARADKQSSRELRLSRDPEKRLKCFSKQWKQLHIRNFETYQWTTISPFFAKGEHKKVSFYKLKDQTILPFISINQNDGRSNARTLEFEGGFSRVFKVDIHPDHHNFEGDGEKQSKNKSFAVKGLHSRDREDFDKEVEMLKRFSDPSVPAHKHLISLLATYQHFGTYFLIFHWADADLRRYWKDVNPNPVMDRRTVKWVAQQCKGIAEGVCAIHQYTSSSLRPQPKNVTFGHHGDIKPENVLWFSEPNHEQTANGTLKLSDFGLAALSMHQTRSMQPKSKLATSLAYQAPEVDTDGTHAIGRSYDIWTLGCLYLEFITWLMGGWDLVGEFLFFRIPQDVELGQDGTTFYGSNQAPNFYVLNPVKIPGGKWNFTAEVKPAVSKFISRLLADAKCTDFLRDFIEMIRDDLLVIKANNRQKLDGDRDRATSREVLTRLSKMLRNCENVSGYGY
ncbi:kinase-like domain-containing protein [Cadophora sp. MPI-SDFR-AT-0126]|nr:kinase-like domain-containing protein [Leotiomycetes sp. MPI-SDFR-AT-0126]